MDQDGRAAVNADTAKPSHTSTEPKPLSPESRQNSWDNKVVVYVESNDALYIASKSNIKEKPQYELSLPLIRQEKDIFITDNDSNDDTVGRWVATVKLTKVKGYRLHRVFGKVRLLYVFESPPRVEHQKLGAFESRHHLRVAT